MQVSTLLESDVLSVRHIRCGGERRHESDEECTRSTVLVLPCRGLFTHRVGRDAVVADPGRLIVFNARETYRISHPVPGGDDCLSLTPSACTLEEMIPGGLVGAGPEPTLLARSFGVDMQTRALAARLSRPAGLFTEIDREAMALEILQRTFQGAPRRDGGSWGQKRLVERARMILGAEPERRWTLRDAAREVGVSPIYLTQVFQRVEGVSLYRWLVQARLGRALHLLAEAPCLAVLAHDLGFSSQSHFGAAFRAAFGDTPARFRQRLRRDGRAAPVSGPGTSP
ncbi:AraC family transcriptional regulator [Brevundimonas diminuta]|nr:AraC family transcriptional regulator [Brevundimonas diminuta]